MTKQCLLQKIITSLIGLSVCLFVTKINFSLCVRGLRCVLTWRVEKNGHNLERVSWGPAWVKENGHFLKRVSWGPAWVEKNEHFFKRVSWGLLLDRKNLHVLTKVSWDRRVYWKVFTFSRSSVGSQRKYPIRGERQRRVAKHREQPKLCPLELYSSPVFRP